jgi:circadian clock protein KaiC
LDGIDQLLTLGPDLRLVNTELLRLRDWLRERDISVLMTAKESQTGSYQTDYLEQLRFDLSTLITLSSERSGQRISRRLRISKYRGSGHVADEVPLLIGPQGVVLPYNTPPSAAPVLASSERVSTGVEGLDRHLGGGYFRGTATLITGEPGTSKTSLAAAFAAAAAARGEKVLYISFDETASQILRNMRSIGMDLESHRESGRLVILERRSWLALAETHFCEIIEQLDTEQPDCVVIDPVSAVTRAGGDASSYHTIERLMDSFKARGMTCVVTSLIQTDTRTEESSVAQVSTIADTWLALNYQIHDGERNRSISVVKSRGTPHSNQVRELVLSAEGIHLADVYAFGSQVLMGTARLHQEHAAARAREKAQQQQVQRRRRLEHQLRELQLQTSELEAELADDSALLAADQNEDRRLQDEIMQSRQGAGRAEDQGEHEQ